MVKLVSSISIFSLVGYNLECYYCWTGTHIVVVTTWKMFVLLAGVREGSQSGDSLVTVW